MASNGALGYRRGPHMSQPSASVDLPEIGARVSAVSGANLRLKDIRLGTLATWRLHGSNRRRSHIERVKWTIGSET